MPFDGPHNPIRLENLLKAKKILAGQTDRDQHDYSTCLWSGFVKERMTGASQFADRIAVTMSLLGVDEDTAMELMGANGVLSKREIINDLLGRETRHRSALAEIDAAMKPVVF